MQSARVNHRFTFEEKRKLNNFESIDYLAPNSVVYRKWLARQPHRRSWDRWLMMGSIGSATGLVAYFLHLLITSVADFKYETTRYILVHLNMGVAWLFNIVISCALVAGSSYLVVFKAPEANGSGIPEVMAYLNGCMVPKVFNIFTVIVKFFSCGLAVASGLPVGPEGPLIHIGAALGAALSQGHSTTLGFSVGFFKRFRNPKDKRDFVTAGVAVGVAAAFNAPIGGLLFAFEEVASFWQQSLGWQAFFACMCAVLSLNLARSAGKAMIGQGYFGWFDREVVYEVGLEISSHALAVLPALVLGLAAGLLAIVFTLLNLKVVRLRQVLLARASRWQRVAEPVALAALYVTGCMLLPLSFPCKETSCVTYKGQVYCDMNHVTLNSEGTPTSPPLNLPMYTCAVRGGEGNRTWIPDSGTLYPDSRENATSTVYYNELATLLFSTGDDGIKHLLARGTHRRFGYHSLLTLLCWYTLGAAVVSGSAISSGLFVPMLMMGATLGRVIGLATTDVAQFFGQTISNITGSTAMTSPWTWIDPGAFALVGAGAVMGGITRLTVALAVITVEISDDVHMLLPILIATLVAKWVADACTHSLYHSLLQIKCVPFLSPEPVSKYSLDLLPVSAVMRSPVVCMRPQMSVRELQEALRDTAHNGFPVVRESDAGQLFVGLIARPHLMVLVQKLMALHSETQQLRRSSGGGQLGNGSALPPPGTAAGAPLVNVAVAPLLQVTYPELNRKMMDPVTAQDLAEAEQQMVALARAGSSEVPSGHVGILDEVVDLTPYINTSAVMVPDTFSIERTYLLFRTLGLRHLVVVDERHRVRGMVTRKDLLGWRVDEALARALARVESARHLGALDWTSLARHRTGSSRNLRAFM